MTRLCDLSPENDVVTSVSWNEKVAWGGGCGGGTCAGICVVSYSVVVACVVVFFMT